MRSVLALMLLAMLLLAGCSSAQRAGKENNAPSGSSDSKPMFDSAPKTAESGAPEQRADQINNRSASVPDVSLNQAGNAQASEQTVERKIIRNADVSLDVSDPAESQRRVSGIAESHGGFVVTSDATQRAGQDQTKPATVIKLTVRVPAAQFNQTMEEIRGIGGQIRQEKISGQDVTEEYIDLEARIRTKRALEAQFMEIMKQAKTVSDALEVQTELANVRTDIERLEGRRRFLDNQASLSTINVTLQPPTPLVTTTGPGFFSSVKRAFGDGVDAAAAITLFFVSALITLLPVALFIFLPLALIVRYVIRRVRRKRLARDLERDEPLAASNPQ